MCDLKGKFEEWREWLFGEDTHSIQRQILNMIWDAAVFCSINESRKCAETDEDGEPQLNKMVHGFINHSFFQTQALAIRRLLDRETREGKYSVFSLCRLVLDVEQNCALLTRENILAALGYPYKYEDGLRKFWEALGQKKSCRGLEKYKHSKAVHNNIDSLSGVDPSQRCPNDTVKKELLGWLRGRLGNCEDVYKYVNKFLAHAATPESRAAIEADDIEITLGGIFNTHKIICEIAQFIGINILYRSLGNFLIVPQYNQFEHFEKPWVPKSVLPKLNDHWQEYYKETISWKDWDWQTEFNEHK